MSQSVPPRDKLIDREFGRYRLVERIGRGGMGAVYRAIHTEIPDLVAAVKVISQSCIDDGTLRSRFRAEAAICARLGERSPYIVRIRDYGIIEDLDLPYFIMDYIQGRSLESVIKKELPLPLPLLTSIVRQLCDGLKTAHEEGVVHRDLKPTNIFLIPDSQLGERVKILDFGIAKFLEDSATYTDGNGPLTRGYMGTPRYSSPEQLMGGKITAQSDIYSLGMILYELFCGVMPFKDCRAEFAFWYHHHTQVPPLAMAVAAPNSQVPAEIEAVIQQCLAKAPQDRPESAVAISQQFEQSVFSQRQNQDQSVLDYAIKLSMQGRWIEAQALAQSIAYGSPSYSQAQTCLNNWKLEVEHQQVIDQARLLANQGELVEAVSIVATIPPSSSMYPSVQSESQRWSSQALEAIESLAWQEKWSEALEQAEKISTLPGIAPRISPLMAQWRKEKAAAEVLQRAEALASEQRWEQATGLLDSIPPGTIGKSRALQWQSAWSQRMEANPGFSMPPSTSENEGRSVTVLGETPAPTPTPPKFNWVWLGGGGAALLAVVATIFFRPSPPAPPAPIVEPEVSAEVSGLEIAWPDFKALIPKKKPTPPKPKPEEDPPPRRQVSEEPPRRKQAESPPPRVQRPEPPARKPVVKPQAPQQKPDVLPVD